MVKKLFSVAFIVLSVQLFAYSPSVLSNTHLDGSVTALLIEAPILSNFRVESSNKNRVYFDSNVPLTASTSNGFIVSGKSVNGITINTGQTTGHYVSVSSNFNFWDNNTIRYEGGSNIQSADAIALTEFTLSYIKNNIPEPDALENRYVTNAANGGGDGLSEGSSWTLAEAFSKAAPGQTIWMKAGDYGEIYLTLDGKNGSASNPIKFIGYKNTIGDITSNYWDYGIPFNSSEMPTMTGNYAFNTSSKQYGRGIYFGSSNYVIFRNFQITKYQKGIWAYPNGNQANSNLIFDRINGYDFDDGNSYGSGFSMSSDNVGNTNIRFLNSVIMNYEMVGLELKGDGFGLIDNVKIYNDDNSEKPDYQIMFNGHNNIVRNCHIEIKGDYYSASTHGIGVRGDEKLSSTYNLMEKNTALNMNESYYIRNYGSNYNVIKDSYAGNNGVVSNDYRGGVSIWGNANYNTIERLVVDDVVTAIEFKDNAGEDLTGDTAIGHDNIIRNCTFNNFAYAVSVVQQTSGATGAVYDNQIVNCTFNSGKYMYFLYNEDIRNLDFINCSFTNFQQSGGTYVYQSKPITGVNYTNCNFYNNNFATPSGVNIISVDPKFESPLSNNFKLQADSELIDKGKITNFVNFDFEGNSRFSGASHDIGAFEFQSSFTGSVSPDISICNGESTVLTASGGTSYSWDTGDSTASITVNPTTTTTYSVTIVDTNGTSNTLDVLVTVDEAPLVDLGADQSICYGETVILTATGTGNFLWNTGETTASITVNPTVTTTYSITASNSCATDATDEIIINVNPEIGLTVGNDISICVGESTTLTATGNGDFLWNTGETTPSITVQPNSTTTYSVTSSLGTCTENASILVTVSEAPSVDLGADQSICYGESVTLTATGTGDFLWNTGETTASITVNPTTTTTYTVTASNFCATNATDDIIVNVNPEIGLTVGNDISICVGENTTLTATGNGDFLWNTGETTPSITVQPNSTTTYTVTSSLGTCTENASILVTVSGAPSVDLGADQSICYGETVTLTATGTGDFLWNTGETTASITVNPTTTTTYTVTASNTCSDDVTDDIIINVNPEIGLTVGNDISICTGESTTLTATGNGDFLWSTGETTPSITVQPNSTTTYTVTSSLGTCTENASVIVTISDSSSVDLGPDKSICYGETVTLTATGSGNFLWNTGETTASITVNPTTTITYSVTASNSCSGDATDDIIVNVNELPSVNAGDDITILNGESTTLTATGNGNFLWSTGETSPSITVNPTGTTTYSVVITSDQGCLNQDTVVVTVENSESIIADAGPDQNVCPDSSDTVLTASGGDSYLWSTGETTASITVSPTVTTVYTVAVYKGNSHTFDEVTVYIDESCSNNISSVQQEFKLYPNPTHGILHIEMTGVNGDLSISLFNLSGTLVYSENLNNSSKEKVLKQKINLNKFAKGIYFVRLDSNGSRETKKIILI